MDFVLLLLSFQLGRVQDGELIPEVQFSGSILRESPNCSIALNVCRYWKGAFTLSNNNLLPACSNINTYGSGFVRLLCLSDMFTVPRDKHNVICNVAL